MSKRFGRNQKRRMRQEIEALGVLHEHIARQLAHRLAMELKR